MKRSQINEIIEYTIQAAEQFKIPLPPFAFYTPEAWKQITEQEVELVDNMLGWDVTDFATADFTHVGLTVFTFRNGNFKQKETYPKPYCEKLLFVRDGQILPFHFHWYKMEDIINRGGGSLKLTLYNSTKAGEFADTDVVVKVDGKRFAVPAGETILLKPGQSITLAPGQYHQWQGLPGSGDIALFEVSTTNDDRVDNRFYKAQSRIPEIEEDTSPTHLIFKDYAKYIQYI